jgi:Fe-S-cluster-containing hydrogenase component 2
MVAFFSPARIRRNASSCIDCAKCAKACPSFFGIVGFAQATGHWNFAIPNLAYEVLVPHADQAAHPMPK